MRLTKAEAELLLPIGVRDFAGTLEELSEDVRNAYYVWDDAPIVHWERKRAMDILSNLADKLGFSLETWEPASIHQVF